MSAYKPACQTLFPWLKANLGKHCLAPLTTTDALALRAASSIEESVSKFRIRIAESARREAA